MCCYFTLNKKKIILHSIPAREKYSAGRFGAPVNKGFHHDIKRDSVKESRMAQPRRIKIKTCLTRLQNQSKSVPPGLIYYIDTKAKCRHFKKLICKDTLRQVGKGKSATFFYRAFFFSLLETDLATAALPPLANAGITPTKLRVHCGPFSCLAGDGKNR